MSENALENRKEFGIHAPYQGGAFVHSMANFASIFKKILSGLSPRSYCEIGVEGQIMTEIIVALARPDGCMIYGIDPTVKTHPGYENYISIQKPSLEGLRDVSSCDVYFVDGDHNYYTVKRELELIKEVPASDSMFPLLFLHDVGWPQDRRDSYYQPSHVPDDHRHKSDSGLGVDPALQGLSEFGLAAGNSGYVFANDRGGAENGVLTAVEDFVRENPAWGYQTIPGVFGLAIVHKHGGNEELDRKIAELGTAVSWLGEEISILEYNRLQLLCESYRAHYHFSRTTDELSTWRSRNADLEREIAEAYRSRDAADARAEALHACCESIMRGWSFRIGSMITFPARRVKLLFK